MDAALHRLPSPKRRMKARNRPGGSNKRIRDFRPRRRRPTTGQLNEKLLRRGDAETARQQDGIPTTEQSGPIRKMGS